MIKTLRILESVSVSYHAAGKLPENDTLITVNAPNLLGFLAYVLRHPTMTRVYHPASGELVGYHYVNCDNHFLAIVKYKDYVQQTNHARA